MGIERWGGNFPRGLSSPFLWTGTTLASFQSLGRDSSYSDLLKILHKVGAITEAISLSNLAGISSGPVALPTSSAFSEARTVDSFRGMPVALPR